MKATLPLLLVLLGCGPATTPDDGGRIVIIPPVSPPTTPPDDPIACADTCADGDPCTRDTCGAEGCVVEPRAQCTPPDAPLGIWYAVLVGDHECLLQIGLEAPGGVRRAGVGFECLQAIGLHPIVVDGDRITGPLFEARYDPQTDRIDGHLDGHPFSAAREVGLSGGLCCTDADGCVESPAEACQARGGGLVAYDRVICCRGDACAPEFWFACIGEDARAVESAACVTAGEGTCRMASPYACASIDGELVAGSDCADPALAERFGITLDDVTPPPPDPVELPTPGCTLEDSVLTVEYGSNSRIALHGAWARSGAGYAAAGVVAIDTHGGEIALDAIEVEVTCGGQPSMRGTAHRAPDVTGVGEWDLGVAGPGRVEFGFDRLEDAPLTGFDVAPLNRSYSYLWFRGVGLRPTFDGQPVGADHGSPTLIAVQPGDPTLFVEVDGGDQLALGISRFGRMRWRSAVPLWLYNGDVTDPERDHFEFPANLSVSGEIELSAPSSLPFRIVARGEFAALIPDDEPFLLTMAEAMLGGDLDLSGEGALPSLSNVRSLQIGGNLDGLSVDLGAGIRLDLARGALHARHTGVRFSGIALGDLAEEGSRFARLLERLDATVRSSVDFRADFLHGRWRLFFTADLEVRGHGIRGVVIKLYDEGGGVRAEAHGDLSPETQALVDEVMASF